MADEQPNTPSAEPQATDAPASQPSSAESEREASSPHWWQRLFHRPDEEPDEQAEDQAAESAPSTLSVTQEELDRRVQAETDRREAKRLAEQRAKAKRELRDNDPWQYAELERQEEQIAGGQTQMHQFLAQVGSEHDKVTIDPLFLSLPKAEQERILKLEGVGSGLTGRKLVVDEALKALERHWKAEGEKQAEAKLRRNQAFRKQVLAEARGQTTEPDLLPAVSASEADHTVSSILRKHYNLG